MFEFSQHQIHARWANCGTGGDVDELYDGQKRTQGTRDRGRWNMEGNRRPWSTLEQWEKRTTEGGTTKKNGIKRVSTSPEVGDERHPFVGGPWASYPNDFFQS